MDMLIYQAPNQRTYEWSQSDSAGASTWSACQTNGLQVPSMGHMTSYLDLVHGKDWHVARVGVNMFYETLETTLHPFSS